MLFQLIRKSFINQKKAMAVMITAVAAGTAVAASLLSISLEISGKVSKELRAFGANILIEPKVAGLADIAGQQRYLNQEDIVKAKTIFWRHNIVGIAPFLKSRTDITVHGTSEKIDIIGTWYTKQLPLPGEQKTFEAGVVTVAPWWHVEGRWPDTPDGIIVGRSLSEKLNVKEGGTLQINGNDFTVTGLLETGGEEDNRMFMDLETLQSVKGLHGRVSHILVSALTKPMDEFAYKDPETMSQAEYEKWYCTGYVTSISKQLEEVFQGSVSKPVWQVAETEGRVLNRLTLLIYFLSIVVLAAAALGVSATMILSLLRRTDEIGLMKAIGADSRIIITLFLMEGMIIGLIGGLIGFVLSIETVQYIGEKVFSSAFEIRSLLLPAAIGSAVFISAAGTILPIWKALHIRPGLVMRGAE